MAPESKHIKLEDCQKGHIYKISARNFNIGIFDGDTGFIGVREKFGDRYLFTEYHWDTGPPFGTVRPLEAIGIYGKDLKDEKKMFEFLEPRQTEINELKRKEWQAYLDKIEKGKQGV